MHFRMYLLALGVMAAGAVANAQLTTDAAGSALPTPVDTRQPGLALHMVVQQPDSAWGIGVPIRMFAYSDSVMYGLAFPGGWPLADGRVWPIVSNQTLFSLLGTAYGGNGVNNFALPDTRGRALMGESAARPRGTVSGESSVRLTAANVAGHAHAYALSPTGATRLGTAFGTGTPFAGLQPALAVNPVVLTNGIFPSQNGPFGDLAVSPTNGFYSQIQFLAGQPFGAENNSRAPAHGTIVPIAQNTALFALMGVAYGGNGVSTYGLPDLRDTLAACWGSGPDLTPRFVGEEFGDDQLLLHEQNLPLHSHTVPGRPATAGRGDSVPFPTAQPTLAVTYFIATFGVYPTENGPRDSVGYLGEVIAMALGTENLVPSGYLRCDGALLPIEEHDALYSLIGTTYGGDGITTFALPDLRGRVPIGAHLAFQFPPIPAGTRIGSEFTTLTAANLPAHVHQIPCPADFGVAGGNIGQDNVYDNNDFIAYITLFFGNSPSADIGRAGGLPGSDGALDNNDFIELINRYFAPC